MKKGNDGPSRATKLIRWIARIWSIPLIIAALLVLVGNLWNRVTGGVADPYAVEGYPAVEVVAPVLLLLSIVGLGIAWRWERLGGTIAIVFVLATLTSLLIQGANAQDSLGSAIPYLLTLIVAVPGVLFLVSGWRSGQGSVQGDR